jgi:hypothetical protein
VGSKLEVVVLPRSAEIVAAEAALRWGLVAFASGQRTSIPLSEAGAAISSSVPRAVDFSIHRHWPADFIIMCCSRRVWDEVVAAGVVDGRDFSLRFSPWSRELQAVRQDFRFRVHIELTGVLAHAFNKSTAAAVLGSAAWVERLGDASASREDMGRLLVIAWTDCIELLPTAKALLIEEPDGRLEEDDGLILPGDAPIPLEKKMLRYVVSARVVRFEDMSGGRPTLDDDGDGDDGGSLRRGRRRSTPEPRRDGSRHGGSRHDDGRRDDRGGGRR